jgi:hypothetical protein
MVDLEQQRLVTLDDQGAVIHPPSLGGARSSDAPVALATA